MPFAPCCCCCCFKIAAAAAAGQFAASPPGQGQVPGGFYWTGGYWGYCPPPTPPAPMAAPPPPPGTTVALIKSPTAGFEVAAGPTGLAPVLLDATGSAAAPGRRIVSDSYAVLITTMLSFALRSGDSLPSEVQHIAAWGVFVMSCTVHCCWSS
jgi:hypothetical protein